MKEAARVSMVMMSRGEFDTGKRYNPVLSPLSAVSREPTPTPLESLCTSRDEVFLRVS